MKFTIKKYVEIIIKTLFMTVRCLRVSFQFKVDRVRGRGKLLRTFDNMIGIS